MRNLTDHFVLEEFTASMTARLFEIGNTPDENAIKNMTLLCENVLEPLRALLQRPLFINSGYRSSELNKRVGGVSNSQHMTGEAADVRAKNLQDANNMVKLISDYLDFDQVFVERSAKGNGTVCYWVHVSYKKSGNRKQVLSLKTKSIINH